MVRLCKNNKVFPPRWKTPYFEQHGISYLPCRLSISRLHFATGKVRSSPIARRRMVHKGKTLPCAGFGWFNDSISGSVRKSFRGRPDYPFFGNRHIHTEVVKPSFCSPLT